MSRFASDSGGSSDFKQPNPGTYLARSYSIVDLGTQRGEYLGEPTVRPQIIVRFELPTETVTIDGIDKPLIVSKFYTRSLGEKANLRKDLESWRSRPFTPEELRKFDLANILNKPCMLSIVHNDKGKAKIVGVSALPKGITCPPAFNKIEAFWLDEWDDGLFSALPEGFQRIIKESDEWKELNSPRSRRSDDQPELLPLDDSDALLENDPPF